MQNLTEEWIDNNNNIIYTDKFLRLNHYYGRGKYSISVTIRELQTYKSISQAIKEAKSRIKEAKKHITPLHGVMEYI
jgi:hypothetical protein